MTTTTTTMSLVPFVLFAWATLFACTPSPVGALGVAPRRPFLHGAAAPSGLMMLSGHRNVDHRYSCLRSSKNPQSESSSFTDSGRLPRVISFGKRPILRLSTAWKETKTIGI